MSKSSPSLAELGAAQARLAPHVRRTPILRARLGGIPIVFKLEQLQLGGSFKIRGALNRMLDARATHVVTASGGNHGIGVALAAAQLGVAATVFVPESAPLATARRIERSGARCLRHGLAWDDAWAAAEAHVAAHGGLLVHPFEDPAVIAGQATVGLELFEDAPEVDGVVVAIGGGGLAAGVALAAGDRAVVGVEPSGARSMQVSIEAGRVRALDKVSTIAGTLAPRSVGPLTHAICADRLREIVIIEDEEMRAAMRRLWDELRIVVEPAGAATLAALLSGRMRTVLARPALIVCGANPEDAEARRLF